MKSTTIRVLLKKKEHEERNYYISEKIRNKSGVIFFCRFGNFLFQKMISDGNTFPVARRKLGGDFDGIAECRR